MKKQNFYKFINFVGYKLFLVLTLATFIIFISGCGGSSGGGVSSINNLDVQNPLAPTNAQMAKLSGIVTYNKVPVSNAIVQLYPTKLAEQLAIEKLISSKVMYNLSANSDSQKTFYSTKTDANGYYCFENIPLGEYTLIAMMDSTRQFVMPNIVLPTITTVNAEITPTGKITGKINISTTSTSTPSPSLAGALVYLQGTSFVSITDAEGNFEISNVPANATYTIKVTFGKYYLASNIAVSVPPGKNLTLQTLILSEIPVEHSIISGLVYKANTNMHDGVIVVLKGLSNNIYSATVTGSSGVYNFSGLKPGEYLIQFVAEGYLTYATNTRILFENQSLEIPAITLQNHSKVLSTVTGRVSFPTVIHPEIIKIVLLNTQTYSFYETYTNINGSFTFNNVIPNTDNAYKLIIATESGYRFISDIPAFSVTPNQTYTFTTPLPIELTKPYILSLNYSHPNLTINGINLISRTVAKIGRNELVPTYSIGNAVVTYDLSNVLPGTYTIILKNPDGLIIEGPQIFVPVSRIENAKINALPGKIELSWLPVKFADRYNLTISDFEGTATDSVVIKNSNFAFLSFNNKSIEPNKVYIVTITPFFGDISGEKITFTVQTPNSYTSYDINDLNLSLSYTFKNASVDGFGNIIINTEKDDINYLQYIINNTIVATLTHSNYLRYDVMKNAVYLNNGAELQKFDIQPTNPSIFVATPNKVGIYNNLYVKCDSNSERIIVFDWNNISSNNVRIRIFDKDLNIIREFNPDQLSPEIINAFLLGNGQYLIVLSLSSSGIISFNGYKTNNGQRIGGGIIGEISQVIVTDFVKLNEFQFLLFRSLSSPIFSEVLFYNLANESIYMYNMSNNGLVPYTCVPDNYSNLWGLRKDREANIILGVKCNSFDASIKHVVFSSASPRFKALPELDSNSIFIRSVLFNPVKNKVVYVGKNTNNDFYSLLSFDPR